MQRSAVFALCALALAAALPLEQSFETDVNGPFAGWTFDELKAIMGTDVSVPVPESKMTSFAVSDIPASFDARDKWGSCITPIRNQLKCGSCWAFGAAESFSDRLCIAGGASDNATALVLSPEDLVSCDVYGNQGCNGGIPHLAWDYMEFAGLVSDSCFPYTAGKGTPAPCTKKCSDGSKWTTHKVQKLSTKGYKTESAIQTAIMTNGPVEAAFSVYEDFMNYKSGVYSHQSGKLLGGHAVRMVGWGEESGEKYWLIANSWGTTWGLQGLFKIKRGDNECGIEQGVVAGLPDASAVAHAKLGSGLEADSKLCTACKKAADAIVNKLVNVLFQGGVVGGCADLCSKLDKKAEQEACDALCVIAGEVTFEDILKKVQLNPEHLCVDLHVCKE